jgi:hypothetical protein
MRRVLVDWRMFLSQVSISQSIEDIRIACGYSNLHAFISFRITTVPERNHIQFSECSWHSDACVMVRSETHFLQKKNVSADVAAEEEISCSPRDGRGPPPVFLSCITHNIARYTDPCSLAVTVGQVPQCFLVLPTEVPFSISRHNKPFTLIIYLFIYSLFKDAFSSSNYIG